MKNQIKLIALLSFLPMLLIAQGNFSGGINVGSEISVMKIQDSKSPAGITEKGNSAVGYVLGAHVNYQLNSNLFLRSGFAYEHSVHQHKINEIRFGPGLEGTNGYVINKMTINSLAIPLELVYKMPIKNEKGNLIFGFGGMANFNIDEKSSGKLYVDGSETQSLEEVENEIDPAAFSLLLRTGFEFGLKNNMLFSIEPYLKYTPNEFTLYLFDSEAVTLYEVGLTARIDLF